MALKDEIAKLYSEYSVFILCDSPASLSTWEAELSTGKALEFIVQFALLKEFKELGATIKTSSYFDLTPALFYLRNEIPSHHGAQAGHEVAYENYFPLSERFLAAFLPKAEIDIRGKKFMLFREGNPLHLILHTWNGGEIYKERPDFSIISGEIFIESYNQNTISFIHKDVGNSAKITLTIKNSNLIPLAEYITSKNYEVKTFGIIECSISKSKINADKQLDGYIKLFSTKDISPECLFVNGEKEISKHQTINLKMDDLYKAFSSIEIKNSLRLFLIEIINK